MEMIQQLFMVAFAAFVFSILVEKLAYVTINGEEWKSKRTKANRTKSKRKSKKKVHFAVHDQIAIVINNKLIKLGAINRPLEKQMVRPTSYDSKEVYLGANWIGEELMIYKELGLHLEHHELGYGTIQYQRKILNDETNGFVCDR
ncbi:hypothetical protein L1987_13402 [Smallanthus sonchifolius]|uniref:Uncharacterized protein n=1 Tax=Smallanthus sonchifolius TaxID=185202 RepID=A0ACB9JHC6_9ASTR|nr:hypothetical protein L1987_13402 [Smallanthus sonchifolius]